MASSRTINYALRALQLVFAIAVLGTDGYAIHFFRSDESTRQNLSDHPQFGNFFLARGVPASWGLLLFCAAWTFLVVAFGLVTGNSSPSRVFIGYTTVFVEAVALLSWFAGFIAVAVDIDGGICFQASHPCQSLTAATVLGAFEWLLFTITTALAARLVLHGGCRARTTTKQLAADVPSEIDLSNRVRTTTTQPDVAPTTYIEQTSRPQNVPMTSQERYDDSNLDYMLSGDRQTGGGREI